MTASRLIAALAAAIAAIAMNSLGAATTTYASYSIDRAGRPLTRGELAALFRGKTWLWKDGGGYFHRSGRFLARTGIGRTRTGMRGGWGAYRGGKVCFSGHWTSPAWRQWARMPEWNAFRSTCFKLRKIGRRIYQRRLPVGDWYVFRHSPTRKSDEFIKLPVGNYSNWYRKWRRRRVTKRR